MKNMSIFQYIPFIEHTESDETIGVTKSEGEKEKARRSRSESEGDKKDDREKERSEDKKSDGEKSQEKVAESTMKGDDNAFLSPTSASMSPRISAPGSPLVFSSGRSKSPRTISPKSSRDLRLLRFPKNQMTVIDAVLTKKYKLSDLENQKVLQTVMHYFINTCLLWISPNPDRLVYLTIPVLICSTLEDWISSHGSKVIIARDCDEVRQYLESHPFLVSNLHFRVMITYHDNMKADHLRELVCLINTQF